MNPVKNRVYSNVEFLNREVFYGIKLNSELYLTESPKIPYNFYTMKQVVFSIFTKSGEDPFNIGG